MSILWLSCIIGQFVYSCVETTLNFCSFLLFLFFNDFYFSHYSWFTVSCQFSAVQQSDPVTHTHTHTYIYILFSHYPPSCSITSDYSSQCSPAGHHCLSTPNATVASINPGLPVHPTLSSSPLATTSFFPKSVCFLKSTPLLIKVFLESTEMVTGRENREVKADPCGWRIEWVVRKGSQWMETVLSRSLSKKEEEGLE